MRILQCVAPLYFYYNNNNNNQVNKQKNLLSTIIEVYFILICKLIRIRYKTLNGEVHLSFKETSTMSGFRCFSYLKLNFDSPKEVRHCAWMWTYSYREYWHNYWCFGKYYLFCDKNQIHLIYEGWVLVLEFLFVCFLRTLKEREKVKFSILELKSFF